jgi:3-oxoacyl-[acyl-carrier protein] reductase
VSSRTFRGRAATRSHYPLDLASLDSVRAAVAAVLGRFGQVDILVNNAVYWGDRSATRARPFEDEPPEEWLTYLRRNVEGAYAAVQAVLPAMRARGWGRIVNVSSGIAADGLPGSAPYGAAKAALHGLTRTLAKELGRAGILVNVVMPGPTLTDRIRARMPAAALEERERTSALGRLLEPEEVASAIAYLCSAANVAITGEIIRASGGYAAP